MIVQVQPVRLQPGLDAMIARCFKQMGETDLGLLAGGEVQSLLLHTAPVDEEFQGAARLRRASEVLDPCL